MDIMEKYVRCMNSGPNECKRDAVKTRLRLDEYEKCVNRIDKNMNERHIKFARKSANVPELLALGMTAYCVRNTCLENFHTKASQLTMKE